MTEDLKKWKMARRGIVRVGFQAARRAKETALIRSEERKALKLKRRPSIASRSLD